MIFDLVKDFGDVLDAMPKQHPRQRILKLLHEAIRRDVHFIDRHPTTFFQCMWNTCWWYDCPEALDFYDSEYLDTQRESDSDTVSLYAVLEAWRKEKASTVPEFRWIRTLRPPVLRLGSPMKLTLKGHEGQVKGIDYSPDGACIASVSDDTTARIWNTSTGELVRTIAAHDIRCKSVAYSPDGSRLYTSDVNQRVQIWKSLDGSSAGFIGDNVISFSISADGRRLAAAYGHSVVPYGHSVVLYDTESLDVVAEFPLGSGYIDLVRFSPDGRQILTTCSDPDNVIRIWNAETGEEIRSERHSEPIYVAEFSPDGQSIAIGGSGNLEAFSVEQLGEPRWSQGFPLNILSLAFSPDGRELAVSIGGELDTPASYAHGEMGEVRIYLLDSTSGESIKKIGAHDGDITRIVYSPSGREIASGSRDTTIRVWDHADESDRSDVIELTGCKSEIDQLIVSPHGRFVAYKLRHGHFLQLLDGATLLPWPGAPETTGRDDMAPRRYAFSEDDGKIAGWCWSWHHDPVIKVWDPDGWNVIDQVEYQHVGRYNRGSPEGRMGWVSEFMTSNLEGFTSGVSKKIDSARSNPYTPLALLPPSRSELNGSIMSETVRGETRFFCSERGTDSMHFPIELDCLIAIPHSNRCVGTYGRHLFPLEFEGTDAE